MAMVSITRELCETEVQLYARNRRTEVGQGRDGNVTVIA